MGKKRIRSTKVSKGDRKNISSSIVKATARDVSPFDVELNKIKAWRQGKNPWISVPPSGDSVMWTKKRANDIYGDPKRRFANIFTPQNRKKSSQKA